MHQQLPSALLLPQSNAERQRAQVRRRNGNRCLARFSVMMIPFAARQNASPQ